MFTVVLSGPAAYRRQLADTLRKQGFDVNVGHDHQLPDVDDGGTDPTVGFVAVAADDPAKVADAAAKLSWRLRAVEAPPTVVAPGLDDHTADHEDWVRRIVREEMTRAAK